jgi:RimJ/RimL family protein N-acetyltransferase
MFFKKIVGNLVYLSPVSIEDAQRWTEWLNDIDIAIPLGDESYETITLELTEDWIKEYVKEQTNIFDIVKNADDKPIGRILLFGVNHVNRSANIGLFIGEKDEQGKGYGREAMELLLDYGFNLLNLHSIMLGVFSFNKKAINLYKKMGFKEIGRRRDARLICNKYYDLILMDILDNEFMESRISKYLER